jgi:carotenoid cleavage dioxygenase
MSSNIEQMIRGGVNAGIKGVAQLSNALRSRSGEHPYLVGIHAPLREEHTLTNLRVTGTLPTDLNGRYLRIGPNPLAPVNPATHHWFTGEGMVHGVRLGAGTAQWYRNRWIRSAAISDSLGEAPVAAPAGRARGQVNTNVLGIAGRTWALVEAGVSPVLLSDELETMAYDPFGGSLRGSFSAHPHRDPDTGELHAICYRGDVHDTVWHTVLNAAGEVVRELAIPVSDGPSIHDCALTRRYVLVFDLPVTFSFKMVLAGHPFPYRWNPEHPARVGLLPRRGAAADIRWYEVDPCYVFHPCNAFEDEAGGVTVDVVAHDRMFDDNFDGPDGSRATFERWTLGATASKVQRRVIDDESQEFPRYDERLTGKPYRHAYAMAIAAPGAGLVNDTRLFHHDLATGQREVHDFGPRRHPGEFVFVPRHAQAGETEGWLIGLVVDMNTQTTDLAVLAADDFTAPPVALVHLPHRVPPGFHGNWVPDAVG